VADRCHFLEKRRANRPAAVAPILSALPSLFHYPKRGQARAVDLGQYQSDDLLVSGFGAVGGAAAGSSVAWRRRGVSRSSCHLVYFDDASWCSRRLARGREFLRVGSVRP